MRKIRTIRTIGWVLTIAKVICMTLVVLGMFVNEGICTWIGWDTLVAVFTMAILIVAWVYIEKKISELVP